MGKLCKLLMVFIWMTLLTCKKESITATGDYAPKFVVEGWIEQDDYAQVILTHNIPFFTTLDSAQLSEVVIRWAKVSVSDGTNTEVLTATKDSDYFPSFIYRGNELKGKAGKSYKLIIEYAGNTLTSTTTIPNRVKLDSIWFLAKDTDRAQVQVKFKDTPNEKNFYRFYTKTLENKRFVPTLLANHDDKYFNGKDLTLQINRGPVNNLTIKSEPYFKKGEVVFLKISNIPKEGYDFWSTFQDEVINSSNPLIGSTGKIKSNISGSALGIWCGYGSSVHKVTATP
jgi:hypothetical protein